MTIDRSRLRALVPLLLLLLVAAAGCGSAGVVDGDVPRVAPLAASPSSRSPAPGPTQTPSPTPVVTVETVTETEAVPFERVTVEDDTMDLGTSAVTTAGVAGVRTLTYEVTLTDGAETGRVLVSDEVTTGPVDEVTSVGTYEPPPPPPEPVPLVQAPPEDEGCDPNYSGCVPIDSDVDCEGGSGNGPSYTGQVTVVGEDIYGLDADDDGVGCE
jgi:resuscitation-promoting factor RpfB